MRIIYTLWKKWIILHSSGKFYVVFTIADSLLLACINAYYKNYNY